MSFDAKALLGTVDDTGVQALVDTMLLAASADGDVSDAERATLASSISDLAVGSSQQRALSGAALAALLDSAAQRLENDGRDKCIASVKERLSELAARKAALGLAIRVTAADGIVRTSERELIMDLADGLGIDGDDAADLVAELSRR
ncbi:MAG TPA: hypothetical protein ENK23_05750 [Sorangium sp.]|nr:hypothetical protein [Sorangium sp.]